MVRRQHLLMAKKQCAHVASGHSFARHGKGNGSALAVVALFYSLAVQGLSNVLLLLRQLQRLDGSCTQSCGGCSVWVEVATKKMWQLQQLSDSSILPVSG